MAEPIDLDQIRRDDEMLDKLVKDGQLPKDWDKIQGGK